MGSFVFNLNKAFSYSGDPTHYNLTYEIIKFYNLFYEPDIKQSQLEQILKGSLDEDVLPRPAFHLYDPIYNRAPFGVYTAKEWALDVNSQDLEKFLGALEQIFGKNNYSAHGDFSWFASVDYFMANNQEKAWYGLGHILHLIEDMTVPAHSRNDHHLLGEPYEDWARNLKPEDYSLADKLKSNGYSPSYLFSIGQAFDELAKYSNKYFFSKDSVPGTTLSKDYTNPKIIKEIQEDYNKIGQRIYGYTEDENGKLFRVVVINYPIEWNNKIFKLDNNNPKYEINNDSKLSNDYWLHLAPKAVVYGAGVIKLFVDELKWREELAKYDTKKELSFLQRGQVFVNNLLGINQNNQQEEQNNQQEYIFQETPQPKPMRFPVSGDIVKEPVSVPIENINEPSIEVPIPIPQDGTATDKKKTDKKKDDGSIIVTGPKTGDSGGVSPFASQPPEEIVSSSSIDEDVPSVSEPLHLIINEIQIKNNEFIELYNPTDTAINLASYSFCYYSSVREWNDPYRNKLFPETASISAGGYYLIGLEGYPDLNGNPDSDWQVYDSKQLSNTDGSVAIFSLDPTDAIKTIDEVKAGAIDVVAWGSVDFVKEGTEFQQVLGQDKSMQRISGQDTNNNSFDFELKKIPTPTNSNDEIRTPGTFIPDTTIISKDTTWTIAGSPYYIESNAGHWPKVLDGATLTIEPGAIIMPQNPFYTFMEIQGTLKAEGNVSERIVFTSKNDSDYGGVGSASAGDWLNMIFTATSKDSILKNVVFRYGGIKEGLNQVETEMIKVDGGSIEMENVTVEKSLTRGLRLTNSNSKIKNSSFIESKVGILIEGPADVSVIENSLFENNSEHGLQVVNSASPIIKNNQFTNNGEVGTNTRYGSQGAIVIYGAYPNFKDNQVSNNLINGILVHSESIFDQDVVWGSNLPYVLTSNFGDYIIVSEGKTLTLEPDTILKPSSPHYIALLIKGTLLAQAASGSEIIFTSIKDDSFGGDTNNDGSSTAPASNDWKEILFTSTSSGSVFDHVFMYYGSAQPPIILEGGAVVEIKDTVDFTP